MADTRIGAYTIEKELITTRWSSLLACRAPDGTRCALKIFNLGDGFSVPVNAENAALWRRRFEQESFLLSEIIHPNVVRVVDRGLDAAGRPYLVMPYLAANLIGEIGGDIGERVKIEKLGPRRRPKPIPVGRAVAILRQILRGVVALHTRGIVHRDLKPANILMTRRRYGHALVGDLGMASVDGHAFDASGELLGSADYTAPELLASVEKHSPRLDLYSIGAIAYRMLTGIPARRGVCDPTAVNADMPGNIARIVKSCLSPEPAERPGSAQAVLTEIEAWVDRRHG